MRLHPWTLPLLVLVGANAWPLLTVARDRIPGPVMEGSFTERELPRDYVRDENSGIALQWSWMDNTSFDSVTSSQLAEFGFDCAGDLDRCSSDERTAWAVVKIDDERMATRIAAAARQHDSLVARGSPDSVGHDQREQLERSASRLVIAKIGADRERLRAEAGANAILLPVRITAWRMSARSDRTPEWWRVNANLMPNTLHIPSEMAAEFDRLAPDSHYGGYGQVDGAWPLPRYEVVVVIGAAGLPRIEEIRPPK